MEASDLKIGTVYRCKFSAFDDEVVELIGFDDDKDPILKPLKGMEHYPTDTKGNIRFLMSTFLRSNYKELKTK